MMQKRDNNNNSKCKNEKRNSFSKKYSNLLVNKSVQFFYFWAKTRLVQRCVMVLSVVWIVLIFYKSLLVVELMRHDVNVSKETVDALLPKGSGLPKLIQDNFQQYIFTSSKSPTTTSTSSFLSTVDFMKRNFKNLVSISKTEVNNLISDDAAPLLKSNKATTSSSSTNWQSLDYYHWLSLFANYNVSLYNRYVAILPEINLNRILNQNDILKYRNANEIKKYNSILVDTQQTKRNFTTSDSKDDMTPKSDDDVSVRWALYELLGIVILGIPTIYFIVYLLTLFYKCLCSKNYEQWRKSWSTANIKRQYKKIHSRSNLRSCMMCDNSSVNKTECSTCRNESDFDSRSSTDSDYESEKMKSNRKSLSDLSDPELSSSVSSSRKVIDHDDLLNRIINGQKDDIELRPLKMFNSNGDKHKYPVDLVSSGVFKVATSDLSNQIKIWSVNTNETSINLDLSETSASVWSLLLTKDDKFVFIGQSSGCLRVFNLETRSFQFYESSASNGITHLVELKPKWPLKSNSILVKNNSDLQLASNYLVLVARLNGLIEILNWTQSEVTLIYSDQVYNSPITNLVSNGGDHLILTSQEFNFKIAKLNFEYYSAYNKQSLLDVCVVDEGLDLPVTALCMDCVSLATGYQNGLICLWSLSLGKCELRLRNTVETRRKKSVVQIELTQAYVISLSEDHQMFIWSRLSGDLVKEFKFLSPVENRLDLTGIDSGELNTHADGSSVFNGLMSLAKSFSKRVFSQVYSDLGDGADDELVFKPMPRMCLYSRSILITAGCSSILIWNIVKGELVKKIKIKKPLVVNFGEEKTSKCRDNYYSQKNFIKEIRLVEKNAFCDENYSVLFATNVLKNAKKFVLIIDYTDSFYVLKIPSNCFDD